ncbi:MAG: hypothetical protein HZB31_02370 [Nitrospirae bacterium]|nr:hypothetical protein [Nitrospirota bacterium]
MKKKDLPQLLCASYCAFYKPGKDEELACGGFIIIERLVEDGKEIPVGTGRVVLSREREDDLFRALCRTCPFFEHDCDFAAWKRGESMQLAREALNPCGGFNCLGNCLDLGTIDIDDLNRVI